MHNPFNKHVMYTKVKLLYNIHGNKLDIEGILKCFICHITHCEFKVARGQNLRWYFVA